MIVMILKNCLPLMKVKRKKKKLKKIQQRQKKLLDLNWEQKILKRKRIKIKIIAVNFFKHIIRRDIFCNILININ